MQALAVFDARHWEFTGPLRNAHRTRTSNSALLVRESSARYFARSGMSRAAKWKYEVCNGDCVICEVSCPRNNASSVSISKFAFDFVFGGVSESGKL